jgi:hypothetical protein
VRVFTIPKPNGKVRTIYAPSPGESRFLRDQWLPVLENIQRKVCLPRVVHGFVKGKSPVTNAMAHRNKQITVSMDLVNFFDSVTEDKLTWVVPFGVMLGILVDGAARQGLPTSPSAANIAAAPMDQQILRWCKRQGPGVVYTRYADDLTISFNEEATVSTCLEEIPKIIAAHGFAVAKHKTRVQYAKAGRRIVTGVAVDSTVHPTRRAKRRLRAAMHQGSTFRSRGLAEWCMVKLPKAARPVSRHHRRVCKTAANGQVHDQSSKPRRTIVRRVRCGDAG